MEDSIFFSVYRLFIKSRNALTTETSVLPCLLFAFYNSVNTVGKIILNFLL